MTGISFPRPFNDALVVAANLLFVCIGTTPIHADSLPASFNVEQIVEQMQVQVRTQMEKLAAYHALRHYTVEYHGALKSLSAKMDVEIDYDASSGKSLRIVSESGSHMLREKVFKRAVESEIEAAKNRSETALTWTNYNFQLAGSETVAGRLVYLLDVKPVNPSKLLYRGRIWVDGIDFAVTRMEVQPAKNPSFWISKTVIHHSNANINGFWLPLQNRSETKIRIGGTAVMTIDYGTYETVSR